MHAVISSDSRYQ